jgi:ribosomal 50S subunit-associated protein YjgA (DUF615 family)
MSQKKVSKENKQLSMKMCALDSHQLECVQVEELISQQIQGNQRTNTYKTTSEVSTSHGKKWCKGGMG